MALSMDEQRILDEIERRLADEDPVLAARLTAFGRPGIRITLRSRRGRLLASLIALVTLAVISVAVYAVIPMGIRHGQAPRPAPASSQPAISSVSSQAAPPSAAPPAGPASRAGAAAATPSASRSAADFPH